MDCDVDVDEVIKCNLVQLQIQMLLSAPHNSTANSATKFRIVYAENKNLKTKKKKSINLIVNIFISHCASQFI